MRERMRRGERKWCRHELDGSARDVERGAMPGGDEGVRHASSFDLRWGATGVSGDCAADAGDSGTREASFFMHGWNDDLAVIAHNSSALDFHLESEYRRDGIGVRYEMEPARINCRSPGLSDGGEERV